MPPFEGLRPGTGGGRLPGVGDGLRAVWWLRAGDRQGAVPSVGIVHLWAGELLQS